METKPAAMMLIVICTLFTSSAQIFLKMGANNLVFDIWAILTNVHLWMGIIAYGIGAILLLIALRWGELTVLYPIFATSFIWVILIGYFALGEQLTFLKIFGILFIVSGVIFISAGSRKKSVLGYTEAV